MAARRGFRFGAGFFFVIIEQSVSVLTKYMSRLTDCQPPASEQQLYVHFNNVEVNLKLIAFEMILRSVEVYTTSEMKRQHEKVR